MTCAKGRRLEGRPPIVLTVKDREILSRLLRDATDASAACLLREEIDRAEIVPDGVAMESLVRLGSEVKFVEHENPMARRVRLVVPGRRPSLHIGPDVSRKRSYRPPAGTVVPLDGAWPGTKPRGPGGRREPGTDSLPIKCNAPIPPTLTEDAHTSR